KSKSKSKSTHAYLAALPADRREALQKLRNTILALVPNAEECISYSMPAFRVDGRVVAGFLATSKGCSYYPFSGRTLTTLASEVAAYEQTKGALHFDPKRGLPKTLVRKLLSTRLAETARPSGIRAARPSKPRASTQPAVVSKRNPRAKTPKT
ncbi:MAG TPA: DUF1801 domain-containing protein, partial [Polyangiaceae bacterium]